MLSKKYRLSKDKDFQKVLKKGKGVKEKFLILKWFGNNLSLSRFGFVVSNKISKKATERHRIKRRLNEILRPNLSRIEKGYDVVIIVTPEIKDGTYREIKKTLIRILKTANLCREKFS